MPIQKRPPRMTPADIKYWLSQRDPKSHFFDRSTMKFFGDTMANYGVRSKPVVITNYLDEEHTCWVLYRKKPATVSKLKSDTYFDTTTFQVIHSKES